MPRLTQNAQPVFPADFRKLAFTIPGGGKGGNQALIARRVADFLRDGGAVEIRSERDAIDAYALDEVIHMSHHVGERRCGIFLAVRAQHGGRIVQPDEAARLADRIELFVGEIAGNWRQRMGVGMAGDQRLVRRPGDIPEPFLGDMGEIDEDTETIALLDQRKAGAGAIAQAQMRDPRTVARSRVFVEHEPQTRVEGEIQLQPAGFPVTELWRVVTGRAAGRTGDGDVTLWDSVGFAVEDLVALALAYDELAGTDLVVPLDLVAEPRDPKDLFGLVPAAADLSVPRPAGAAAGR